MADVGMGVVAKCETLESSDSANAGVVTLAVNWCTTSAGIRSSKSAVLTVKVSASRIQVSSKVICTSTAYLFEAAGLPAE